MRRIAIEYILETVPHGLLDQAFVITTLSRYGENVKRGPDMLMSWVGSVPGAEQLVDVKFFRINAFSGKDLEGSI
jgi:hypothetical protein